MSGHKGWIGVDLDGTLAHYEGWKGVEHIGEPIPAMVERVKGWLAEGKEVRIFTARVYCPPGDTVRLQESLETHRHIVDWCTRHIGVGLPTTCVKDFGMIELWDDRAYRVVANSGLTCCEVALLEAKQWQGYAARLEELLRADKHPHLEYIAADRPPIKT